MKRTTHWTLPLILAATTAPAFAQAQPVQIYGQLHVSVDHIDSDIDGNSAQLNTSSNASLIGLRGTHRIDDNLNVLWQAESTVDVTNAGDISVDRDTFLGLSGSWGLVRVGQFDTPLKTLRNRTDLFGNQAGDARNITHFTGPGLAGLDRRFKNGIHYRTPSFGGVIVNLHYATNLDSDDDGNAAQSSDEQAYSASVEYSIGGLWAAIAYDDSKVDDNSAIRVAGFYDIGDFRITALYQDIDNPSGIADVTAYGAGVRYALNEKVRLKTQYYKLEVDDANDSKGELVAVGVDYHYAPNLQFYVNYAVLDNDGTTRTPYNVARSASTSAAGATGDESPAAVSVGTIFRF